MSDAIDAEFTMLIEEMSDEELLADLVRFNVEIIKEHIKSCNEALVFLPSDKKAFVIKHYQTGNRWQYLSDPTIMKLSDILTQLGVNSITHD